MVSEYSYRFTEKATQDLDEILHYITFEICSPQAAQNLAKKIFERIDTVRLFPESGALVVNEFVNNKSIRKIVVDNYIVYYTASNENKEIVIVRIVYAKRNLDEIMRSL